MSGKSVRVCGLRGVSLECGAGQVTALLGRSGCGKTTLLNLCGAMDFPTTGEVEVVREHPFRGEKEAIPDSQIRCFQPEDSLFRCAGARQAEFGAASLLSGEQVADGFYGEALMFEIRLEVKPHVRCFGPR